jgi:zinc D-Ala-D-Ala carboxypeptidase
MKDFIVKIINSVIKFIIAVILKEDTKEEGIDDNIPSVIITPDGEQQPNEPPETPSDDEGIIPDVPVIEDKPEEVSRELSVKAYQTYLKKIGLYTKGIDGIVGDGTETAIRQFNIIFLNLKSNEYTDNTDKMLKTIYNSYCNSPYMSENDWQYFRNFKKTEYKCKCGGKYCNGYPSGIAMHLVMTDQYVRNIYDKPVTISSGLRCKEWNKIQGGIANSVHPKGQASDKGINGVKSSTLRATCKELAFVYYAYDITSKYVHTSVNL